MKLSNKARLLATDQQQSTLRYGDTVRAFTPFGFGLHSGAAFNGEWLDQVTGRYLLGSGYRAFSTLLMRFICPDSWSPFGEGGLNAYGYCQGDPVNARDPTGHAPIWKVIGRKATLDVVTVASWGVTAPRGHIARVLPTSAPPRGAISTTIGRNIAAVDVLEITHVLLADGSFYRARTRRAYKGPRSRIPAEERPDGTTLPLLTPPQIEAYARFVTPQNRTALPQRAAGGARARSPEPPPPGVSPPPYNEIAPARPSAGVPPVAHASTASSGNNAIRR